jgi:8-oxo-dGTP diphosphatase
MTVDATLCHIIRGRQILLKKASRGVGVGKWNGPGGKIEPGETPEESVMREVDEETSLRVTDLVYHGKIGFCMNGGKRLDYLVHVFSARGFSGTPRSSEEGEVRWFDLQRIPYAEMWDDDRYWLPLLLNGVTFDARFNYAKDNKHVTDFALKSRARV